MIKCFVSLCIDTKPCLIIVCRCSTLPSKLESEAVELLCLHKQLDQGWEPLPKQGGKPVQNDFISSCFQEMIRKLWFLTCHSCCKPQGWEERERLQHSLSSHSVSRPNINGRLGSTRWGEERGGGGKERKNSCMKRNGERRVGNKGWEKLIILGRSNFELWTQGDVIK